jgi:4-amino-4-deoxy-L-arabinose transferase-like glycosyltransferase
MTTITTPASEVGTRRYAPPGSNTRIGRMWRGGADDPVWVRPALISLLVATGIAYIWGLGASGDANSFYAAAVQAGTKSWKSFFFGSFDPSNFITVDKSPAALWVMELSGRIFGFNSWTMLVPEALEGVGTVGLLYLTVRRWFPPAAALAAGVGAATTPVAALMFRFNNPDALMVMLITLAAYATVRAIDHGRARWMVLAGSALGFAFLAKMLQAFLIVPALALVVLVAAPGGIGRRVRMLLYGAVALVVSAGWWVVAVELTPAADRPYIGGSQNNSLWNLIFGYNGFGRLTGNETGSVGGGAAGTAGRWGPTGLFRLFGAEMGTQVSWLLPAALLLLVAGLAITWRARRTNRTRAGLILWGGWLAVSGLAFSLGQGIIHPYYTVALAPAIGGLIGTGGILMWVNRDRWMARAVMAAAILMTAVWATVLLERTPNWLPWLRALVLASGSLAAIGIGLWPYVTRWWRKALAAGAMVAVLGAPIAYTLETIKTPHAGAIPSAGPTGASTNGLGGGPQAFRGRGQAGFFGRGQFGGQPPFPGAGRPPTGTGGTGGQPTGGGAGGLLDPSKPSAALTKLLETNASRYKWVAATVGANSAAGYQLATGDAVMAIGGFNGTDPYPTLAQFEALVKAGKVHYFIGGGGFGGPGSSGDSSAITQWVEANFQSTTVGGVSVYDLTSRSGG